MVCTKLDIYVFNNMVHMILAFHARCIDHQKHDRYNDKRERRVKIRKGQSESVYRRRTDNTIAKRKSTKGQNDLQNIHIKLKIE